MNKYNMRIANRSKINSNGVYAFSEESIRNVPNVNIFVEKEINEAITNGCKEVLYNSMSIKNKYRYGEQGLLISTLDIYSEIYGITNNTNKIHEYFSGEFHNIKLDKRYTNIVSNRETNDLIMIHNHPNNSIFSANDLITFEESESIQVLVAVGNRSNLFAIVKNEIHSNKLRKFIAKFRNTYINKYNIKLNSKNIQKINNIAAKYIFDNPDKFNVEIYKYRRKSL